MKKSIIIAVHNQHEFSDIAIRAVLEHTAGCEIIVIDNGSEPAFKPPFSGFIETKLIRNETNLGFPVAVNQGIRAATGDVVILLNNDVIVTPGWSEKLELALISREVIEKTKFGDAFKSYEFTDDDRPYSIVGPVCNYAAGIQGVQCAPYQSVDQLKESAAEWSEIYGDETQDVTFVIGFCMAFPRSLYFEIGEFDESLWPCSGEEIDFCFRAREAGHKIGVVLGCYVHHEGSQTFKDMQNAGLLQYEEVCARNDAHLAEKWGGDFWKHQKIVPAEVDGIRLNLGCGTFPLDGFINVDQFESVEPDLLCDVTCLPFKAGTVDEIYAGHILEHFHFEDGKNALRYWFSLLKPGGKIAITVPDYDFLVKKYAENPNPEALIEFNNLYIYSGVQPSPHLFAYSGALLEKVMKETGFAGVDKMPIAHPYFVDPVEWQVGFQGVKP